MEILSFILVFVCGVELSLALSRLAFGDLDGDGHLDVIATEDGDEQIAVLKGKGDGAFLVGVIDIGYDVEVTAAAVADFNGDGVFVIIVLIILPFD